MNDDTVPDGGKTFGFNGGGTLPKGLSVLFFGVMLFVSFCVNAETETGEVNDDGAVVVPGSGDDGTSDETESETGNSGVVLENGVRWRYTVVDGEASVSVDYEKIRGTVYVPPTIDEYPVTRIKARAFVGCNNITNVVIPSSVVEIGQRAFYECARLRSVSMHGDGLEIDNEAFWKCDALTSVFIGGKINSIGENAFRNCTDFERLTISNRVDVIGRNAFYGCEKLSEIFIGGGVGEIRSGAFRSCASLENIWIENGIEEIDTHAFSGCEDLKEVVLPAGLTQLGNYSFSKCTSLRKVIIPGSVKNIGNYAFSDCTALDSVTISYGVEKIGGCSFADCYSLESLHIPDSVTDIDDAAFRGCGSLVDITIPKNVVNIGTRVFSGCVKLSAFKVAEDNPSFMVRNGLLCSKDCTTVLACPEQFTAAVLPEGTVHVMNYVFGVSNHLGRVFLPRSVEEIDASAFDYCANLEEIYLSELYSGATNVFPETAEIIRYSQPMTISEDGAVSADVVSSPSFKATIEGAADMRLAENIVTEAEYASFLEWIGRLPESKLKVVRESANLWLSYAMDSGELIASAPAADDVRIVGFAPFPDGRKFKLQLSVSGVPVGSAAKAANLATLFTVEGAESRKEDAFAVDAVESEFLNPADGKINISVSPKPDTAKSFFYRVKMMDL
jgi:hypothetical protein